jgi:hypothetical protein
LRAISIAANMPSRRRQVKRKKVPALPNQKDTEVMSQKC